MTLGKAVGQCLLSLGVFAHGSYVRWVVGGDVEFAHAVPIFRISSTQQVFGVDQWVAMVLKCTNIAP